MLLVEPGSSILPCSKRAQYYAEDDQPPYRYRVLSAVHCPGLLGVSPGLQWRRIRPAPVTRGSRCLTRPVLVPHEADQRRQFLLQRGGKRRAALRSGEGDFRAAPSV